VVLSVTLCAVTEHILYSTLQHITLAATAEITPLYHSIRANGNNRAGGALFVQQYYHNVYCDRLAYKAELLLAFKR
jgi:hypothetical protein